MFLFSCSLKVINRLGGPKYKTDMDTYLVTPLDDTVCCRTIKEEFRQIRNAMARQVPPILQGLFYYARLYDK